MNLYLCGPINGCTDEEAKDWREAAKVALPYWVHVDPMVRDYRGQEDIKFREIVELDKQDILGCAAILVNYDKPSVGTSMEILFAWEHQIPVFIVVSLGTRISPWLRYHATVIVPSFKEAFRLLELERQDQGGR